MTRFVKGWHRDTFDPRDVHLQIAGPHVPLADSFDLSASAHMPPVYDQGQEGSCTAHAISAAFDFERHLQGLPFLIPSRQAIYYDERAIEGSIGEDAGAEIRDGIKVTAQGVGPESLWPYEESNMFTSPSAQYRAEAVKHKDLGYARVGQSDYDIRHTVQILGRPIAFGIACFSSIDSEEVAKTGVLPMPGKHDKSVGGHAILLVGFDVKADRYKWRNSWGVGWGVAGYGWIPRAYVLNPRLASDFWVIKQESAA